MPVLFDWHVIFNIAYPFFKEILFLSISPLSKVKYYAIRRVSNKRISTFSQFLWVLNQSVLSDSTIDSFIEYLDAVVSSNLLCKQQNFELLNLVKNYQIHSYLSEKQKQTMSFSLWSLSYRKNYNCKTYESSYRVSKI